VKKKLVIGGVVLLVLIIIIGNMAGTGRGGVEVTAEEVASGTVVSRVSASGKIFPVTEVKINSQVSARIERLAVHEGDRVERDQVLVELDRTLYEARVQGARAALNSQRANAEAASASQRQAADLLASEKALDEKGLGRAQALRDARNNSDAAVARYNAALAQVASMEAQLDQALDDLSRTTIRAPMAGTVTALAVEEGEMVLGTQMAMGTQMMAISDLTRMEVEVDVDETDVVSVIVSQDAEVEVDAIPDTLLMGKVTEIANSGMTLGRGTQQEVTNFAVKVELLDTDDRLRPGMSATVDVITDTRHDVLNIPLQAVTARKREDLPAVSNDQEEPEPARSTETGEEEFVEVVFVVQEDGTVEMRQVETGISSTTHVQILSGLSEGEEVVTGPFRVLSRTLKDGQRVTVRESLLEEDERG
jgi:HlyD family secretion protein